MLLPIHIIIPLIVILVVLLKLKSRNQFQEATINSLFPLGRPGLWWTTAQGIPGALFLDDNALRPKRVTKTQPYSYTNAPRGTRALEAQYLQGSYSYKGPRGGFSFYALGPESVDLTLAKELTFSYSAYFPQDFDFVSGGKLPGVAGGDSWDDSLGCSGGDLRINCFSSRLMFRTNGAMEVYLYAPRELEGNMGPNVCQVPPYSECNPDYGSSVGRGSSTFPRGRWITVAQRIKLNTSGVANGEIELFVNGRSVIHFGGITLRRNDQGRVRNLMMQTFFGGNSSAWASSKDQSAYFRDFSVAITQLL